MDRVGRGKEREVNARFTHRGHIPSNGDDGCRFKASAAAATRQKNDAATALTRT